MTVTGARTTVAACTLAVGLAAALGFVPGYVATSLRADLGLSRAEVGLIVSLYFGSTGVMSILGGSVTDRIGVRKVIVGDMVVVAVCAALAAWRGDLAALLLTSVIAGAGYAGVNAATNAAIASVVDPSRRTMALSVKTGGVPAMASTAALLGAPLAASTSWRVVWLVVSLLALCSGVFAFCVLPREAVAVANGVRRGRAP
ncbi:MAG: MFS transporter, partial [Ilumatobacteraceae bacterium]